MLTVDAVSAAYASAPAVFRASFCVRAGEIVSIVGANGAGKSSLLKCIAGALPCRSGAVYFRDADITALSSPAIVRMGLSYIPENRRLFTPLTVAENLEIGAYVLKDRKDEIRRNLDMVYDLFPRLGERKKQPAGTLSGGEQQMLAIGRGLMAGPSLLMLDEPSQGLMPVLAAELLAAVQRLRETGMTILLVEQNVQEALEIADRGYVLQAGEIIHEGRASDLLASDLVRKAFLGL